MAGNRGVTVFVLLLSCWHEAKLQPINMTSVTRRPPSRTFCDTRCVVPGGLVPRPTRPTVHVNLSLLSRGAGAHEHRAPGPTPTGSGHWPLTKPPGRAAVVVTQDGSLSGSRPQADSSLASPSPKRWKHGSFL
ncbi:uncharacterized protein LOC119865241 isoform X6 [Canis lupus familiaris]|uniref:sperm acrosome-associated protein 7 isoform X6 n=1 Tax=Canis lupus dingo TaxID=286419 RepID=UPI0006B3DAAA|nr:sperm acrosome-associated protein 7 isoform X6 [Canis lupus dingo]XP_025296978.1 sperm acrosome-associated protein 7 isoform X6 [Canis lupus dingo]XP_025296979.1 sperm acrosome-associated protein 7 isoform X6 [Canis lupus dingo]XP_038287423.1 uncharacterized protein LOC119865241 isoform X6 [Canis lupus familiaris]XP_038287425.1 uncharacterized protein LOC119865241 isoform X6 [Canis lupus familiaris]XP_038287426.1 uncharacterized protein LOC119865241 isoform X6 [Canis lupus familiaris]XP_03|eukprot:XP_013961922.1 sperm acrosome-associated protein 7 isoform X5 [Canis lupus familiaris]